MNSNNVIRNEGSVDEQTVEQRHERAAGQEPELRRSVEQEIQGKVDTNHPDSGRTGLTLEAEEKLAAHEWEIERTHGRWGNRQESDREARSRDTVWDVSHERTREFERRGLETDEWDGPDREDPREMLTQAELATVNKQAKRVKAQTRGMTRAAISRHLARRIADGMDVLDAVVDVIEFIRDQSGYVIPINQVEWADRPGVSVEGTIETLWEPSDSSIAQVGLIADDSGRIKFTVWEKSNLPKVREGDTVTFINASKNWYEGRCSIALTGWSMVRFPEHGPWWE
ncbi:DNA-binding protein [Halobacteria archaeon HArc-gm2]|nr:DNA-binding protein [Halobacteria archaeon HArc-gm2]